MKGFESLIIDPRLLLGLFVVQGIALMSVLGYVWTRFRKTRLVIGAFQQQWEFAESNHKSLLVQARERVNSFSQPAPTQPIPGRLPLTAETRNHVAAMGRNGVSATEIARTCGIPENAVSVLLGFAQLKGE